MNSATVKRRDVENFVSRKLEKLRNLGDSARRAALANLRRGAGRVPGDMPGLWGTIFEDMPEEMVGTGSSPDKSEWAVYVSLTLFALHQQGRDPAQEPMNQKDISVGRAAAMMVRNEADTDRVLRRFNEAATSSGMEELEHHLRGLINMLRAEGISLDYPKLAGDLFTYQTPEFAAQVRLRWGRDFYGYLDKTFKKQSEEEKS